ncbi:hypothetical protein EMPS_04685 [Entomortierella parvispora]|uniref:F-box domain-containing protein n=1 Tax=Entomortierella parvispora TaxID=205924 RepID=A0A9P3H9H8_9FUNG|nr:hypothetical protein EMPS_04685 [Entomortierella parvispora]
MDFLMQAPKSLQCLRIENNTSTELLDALVFFEHLEELHLSLQNCTPPKWVDLYEPLWSRLRVLSMNLIDADQDDDSLANTASMERLRQAGPTRLTELNLNLSVNYEISSFYPFLVELMLKSPNLVRLGWTFRLCSFPVTPKETFANALRSRQMCKQIEYLDFRGDFLDHTDLEVMLETTTGLKGLQLDCYSFDERSWAILKGNFPRCLETLTYLDVRGCSVPAEMAIEMLFTFMNLETFMAVGIKDTDIERARVSQGPWVCRRLTRLQLGVIPAADGTVPHFLAQVALLDRLEIWSLDFYFQRRDSYDIGRHRPGDRNIELSLETGLDTLKNLRNLKVFEGSVVAYKKIHWQEAEVQWVLKHWVSLETIRNVSIERGDWAALKKQYITKR